MRAIALWVLYVVGGLVLADLLLLLGLLYMDKKYPGKSDG